MMKQQYHTLEKRALQNLEMKLVFIMTELLGFGSVKKL